MGGESIGVDVTTLGGNDAIVALSGELDLAAAPRVADELTALLNAGRTQLTVDLTALTFIDSAGVSVLIKGVHDARDAGGDLVLKGATGVVDRVLSAAGLYRLFKQE